MISYLVNWTVKTQSECGHNIPSKGGGELKDNTRYFLDSADGFRPAPQARAAVTDFPTVADCAVKPWATIPSIRDCVPAEPGSGRSAIPTLSQPEANVKSSRRAKNKKKQKQ